MRRRFFVEQFVQNSAAMTGDAAHHLGRVLRAEPGQLFELSDGKTAWLGRIELVQKERIEFALLEPIASRESALETTLLLSIVKFDSLEWALEKATELGVHTIVPLAAARSEKALLHAAGKRSERWKRILLEASQQSRRVRIPELKTVQTPEQAFAQVAGCKIILSEKTDARPLRAVLPENAVIEAVLAIGPEGGWTDEELAAAEAAGFRQASLGSLILRTETAVISALANLNYALG
ncbi:MAG: 16S rRNA (uracil(1498)-N(3))-methyltransferase [Acidobacteria bacterium]|nr:16S rRNA (uracil(1498)-N(3))-methyltransferase [Acidobacteriota bacterium]MBS1865280.1 16S rRNA (uracil(1498)-N(3))-methyltransferase [Acidobacteriota bacterium]